MERCWLNLLQILSHETFPQNGSKSLRWFLVKVITVVLSSDRHIYWFRWFAVWLSWCDIYRYRFVLLWLQLTMPQVERLRINWFSTWCPKNVWVTSISSPAWFCFGFKSVFAIKPWSNLAKSRVITHYTAIDTASTKLWLIRQWELTIKCFVTLWIKLKYTKTHWDESQNQDQNFLKGVKEVVFFRTPS